MPIKNRDDAVEVSYRIALIIRPVHPHLIYLPTNGNSSLSRSWMGPQSRPGWMVFEIQR